MERSPTRVALAGLALAGCILGLGCRDDSRTAVRRRLARKPVAAVMEEAARAAYTPPATGRLAARQVEAYVRVRERASQISEAAQAPAATAEPRAAQELGFNPKEYAWVTVRVVEAQTAEATRALLRKMAAGREQLITRLAKERDAIADPERKAEAARQAEELRRGFQESQPSVPAAVEANIHLLAPYRERLARLQRLEDRLLVRAAAGADTAADGTERGSAAHPGGAAARGR